MIAERHPDIRHLPVERTMMGSLRPTQLPASLIIGSRNRPELLTGTVASVLEGDEVPAEIVVVDQSDQPHPTLATFTAGCECDIHYRWSQPVGVSRARNIGISVARHDILVIIDDDMTATATWLGTLVRALVAAGPKTVVTGRVAETVSIAAGTFAPSVKNDRVTKSYEGRVGADVLYSNMALHKCVLDEIGSFDERLGPGTPFPAAEDNDLGFRLLEAGYRIVYVPEALLYHQAWRSERDRAPLQWNYGRGQGAFYAKHLSLRDRYMLLRMIGEIKHFTRRAAFRTRRQRRGAREDVLYALGLVYGAARWLLTQPRRGR